MKTVGSSVTTRIHNLYSKDHPALAALMDVSKYPLLQRQPYTAGHPRIASYLGIAEYATFSSPEL
jgi:hypothetical protein